MTSHKQSGHRWTSPSATLNTIRKLQTDRLYRDTHGLFFIEGVRNFIQASDNQFNIEVILHSERLLTAPLARKLVRQHRRAGVPTFNVSPETFRTISQRERASGVAAIVRQRWRRLRDTSPNGTLCWTVLGHLRSAGNFGTLIRSSEAVGGAGFILLDSRADPYDPGAVRASMGAIFRQQFVRTSLNGLRRWANAHHSVLIGASAEGAHSFHQFEFPPTTLLLLGEERRGLTPQQKSLCKHLVSIPMAGQADSLNVGVAGSLLLYEIYRARTQQAIR